MRFNVGTTYFSQVFSFLGIKRVRGSWIVTILLEKLDIFIRSEDFFHSFCLPKSSQAVLIEPKLKQINVLFTIILFIEFSEV